jgi:RNA polymerase sigma-70 factor, ECF subfamily
MPATQMKRYDAPSEPDAETAASPPEKAVEPPSVPSNWALLVAQVQAGQDEGMESLYRLFSRGIRYYLCRQLGPQELEDKVHDTFLIVVNAIKRGDLREPERLMGFVRTVVRRQVAAYIEQAVHTRRDQADLESGATVADRKQNPEQVAILRQKSALMKSVLESMSDRDREILKRFYIDEQSQEDICREMELTETQFRLLKSRAKTKFGELGRKRLASSGIFPVFMRANPS